MRAVPSLVFLGVNRVKLKLSYLIALCALRLLASKPKTERKGGIELKDRLRAEKDRRDKEAKEKGEIGIEVTVERTVGPTLYT